MSGFEPGCQACGALADHPCRRSKQSCPRMPTPGRLQHPPGSIIPSLPLADMDRIMGPTLTKSTPADLDRIASRMAVPGKPQAHPKGSDVVAATPQSPAFAYPCPECLSEPYASCRNDLGDYITHKMVHVARTRVGAPLNDDGAPVFREHNHSTPAQDIARLAECSPHAGAASMKISITGCTFSGTGSDTAEQVWRCTNPECRHVVARATGCSAPVFEMSEGAWLSCGKCGSSVELEEDP